MLVSYSASSVFLCKLGRPLRAVCDRICGVALRFVDLRVLQAY